MTSISARVLGQRVRQLRTRRGLTQQDLAANDYSKSYISAIEQGKTRPSLEALQRIAARLEVPAGTLLDPDAQGFMPFDPEAMPRRVRRRRNSKGGPGSGTPDPTRTDYLIAEADLLLAGGRPGEALDILKSVLPYEGIASGQRLEDSQLQRIYLLAAQASVEAGEIDQALAYAQKGTQISMRLGDRDALERMRNVHGTALYYADQPLSALEHHRACLQAVEAGVIRDVNFKLQVSNSIALDYFALHDSGRALDTYKGALDLLQEASNLEQQATIFQRTAAAYAERDDYVPARLYAEKATHIREAQNNIQAAARLESRYGDLLVERGDLDMAQERLESSIKVAEAQNNGIDTAAALTSLARLYMKREDLDKASETAGRASDISRSVIYAAGYGQSGRLAEEVSAYMQPQAGTPAHRTLAQALALGGEVASKQGDNQRSDKMFDEALEIIEANHAPDISSDIFQRYAQVLAARGQHEQASKYFERAYKAVTKQN